VAQGGFVGIEDGGRIEGEGGEGGEFDGVVEMGAGGVGVDEVEVGGGDAVEHFFQGEGVGVAAGEVGGIRGEGPGGDFYQGWTYCMVEGFETNCGGGFGDDEAGAVLVEGAAAVTFGGEDAEALEAGDEEGMDGGVGGDDEGAAGFAGLDGEGGAGEGVEAAGAGGGEGEARAGAEVEFLGEGFGELSQAGKS